MFRSLKRGLIRRIKVKTRSKKQMGSRFSTIERTIKKNQSDENPPPPLSAIKAGLQALIILKASQHAMTADKLIPTVFVLIMGELSRSPNDTVAVQDEVEQLIEDTLATLQKKKIILIGVRSRVLSINPNMRTLLAYMSQYDIEGVV